MSSVGLRWRLRLEKIASDLWDDLGGYMSAETDSDDREHGVATIRAALEKVAAEGLGTL